jgi:hypothetical protein
MVCNDAIGAPLERATAAKQMTKALLDAMIAAFARDEAGQYDASRVVIDTSADDGPQHWPRIDVSECPTCRRTRFVYEGKGCKGCTSMLAHFCPECWQLDVCRQEGEFLAHASRRVEKFLRALSPGSRLVSMTISEGTVECDPPVKPSYGEPS